LPAIALTTDSSAITSISNDSEYELVFSRQIEAIGRPGDIFWAYTTSGTSKNVLRALEAAMLKGLFTVVFCGQNDSSLLPICDLVISVPSLDTPRVQEVHTLIGHTVSEIVEAYFFGDV
jgi:D-sedoheptulose 7-phosphate isomerase